MKVKVLYHYTEAFQLSVKHSVVAATLNFLMQNIQLKDLAEI